jgi:hypothetical protein
LVYNDEELYKFDPSIDDKPEPFAKVNVKNEKDLNSIENFLGSCYQVQLLWEWR